MESTDVRLARLRAEIAAGTYTPPVDAVAESLVGWIARPEQFERPRRVRDARTRGRPASARGGSGMTMEIVLRGRNVDVAPELDADCRRKLAKLAKLASDIRRIDVEFSEVRNPRVADDQQCEVTVHLTRNLVKAHAAAADARSALDRVVEKVGHQLERVHDKRVHRTRPRHAASPEPPVEPAD